MWNILDCDSKRNVLSYINREKLMKVCLVCKEWLTILDDRRKEILKYGYHPVVIPTTIHYKYKCKFVKKIDPLLDEEIIEFKKEIFKKDKATFSINYNKWYPEKESPKIKILKERYPPILTLILKHEKNTTEVENILKEKGIELYDKKCVMRNFSIDYWYNIDITLLMTELEKHGFKKYCVFMKHKRIIIGSDETKILFYINTILEILEKHKKSINEKDK